jgi:hypothetical protein
MKGRIGRVKLAACVFAGACFTTILAGCLAETAIRPNASGNNASLTGLAGDRYLVLSADELAQERAWARSRLRPPSDARRMIVDDCSAGGVCDPGGGSDPGGGGGGGGGGGSASDDFCSMSSNACAQTYALIDINDNARATSETFVPSGTNALIVSLLGGGIIKRGTLISLPSAFNLGCIKTDAPSCQDTWTGPNTCSAGEFNFLAAGAYHVVAFASKQYHGDTSDSDQCNPISLWGQVLSFGGSGSAGGGNGSDPGEGNTVVTVEPSSSGCDYYTVTMLELDDNGAVTGSSQMDLAVCGA